MKENKTRIDELFQRPIDKIDKLIEDLDRIAKENGNYTSEDLRKMNELKEKTQVKK